MGGIRPQRYSDIAEKLYDYDSEGKVRAKKSPVVFIGLGGRFFY
jgi:hypothetical protein